MKALLLAVLLAPAARADLTLPPPETIPAEAAASAPADAAAVQPLEPMAGGWVGSVRCAAAATELKLRISTDAKRGYILYLVKPASGGGFMASLTLTPEGKPGTYRSLDSSRRLPPALFTARGRVLRGVEIREPSSGFGPRMAARLDFDPRWRSAAVTLSPGSGPSCAGTLKRGPFQEAVR